MKELFSPELDAKVGQAIFDAAPIGMILVSETGHILRANPAFCGFLGYAEYELKDKTIHDITPPDDCSSRSKAMQHAWWRGRGSPRFERRYLHKDGKTVWGQVVTHVAKHGGGRADIRIAQIVDITARKQEEESLRLSEQRFRTALAGLPGAVFNQDCNLRYTWIHSATPLSKAADFIGNLDSDLVDARAAKALTALKRRVMKDGVGRRAEFNIRFRGVPETVDVTVEPLRDDRGRIVGITGTTYNVTTRKEAEEALRKAHDELEQKVKDRTARLRALAVQLDQAEHQERRRIAQLIHDDLQQVVVGARLMLGGLEKSAMEANERKTVAKVEDSLEYACKAMRSLCMDLHPPILFKSGIGPALKWLADDMQRKYGLVVKTVVQETDEPPVLRTFAFNAVRELLFNVVKHGKVKSAHVRLSATDAGSVRIEVRDRGIGFDPKQIKPTSFGLFSIRERTDHLGGAMEIQSKAGKGSCITLTLPTA